jgi:hypothetical protein
MDQDIPQGLVAIIVGLILAMGILTVIPALGNI